jgi:hypothetical protein
LTSSVDAAVAEERVMPVASSLPWKISFVLGLDLVETIVYASDLASAALSRASDKPRGRMYRKC